ncbi:hypothetical protein Gpo141_00014214, partial [Globisporangium polare]
MITPATGHVAKLLQAVKATGTDPADKYRVIAAPQKSQQNQPQPPSKKKTKIKFKKVTLSQLWRLLYRLIVLVAAVGYV